MPEITLAGVLITISLNIFALLLLVRQQITAPKEKKPGDKKRISMNVIAYMVIGSNTFIFLYVWWDLFVRYFIPKNLPLSLALGIMGGSLLAWWMKTYLESPSQQKIHIHFLKKNASWHRLFFLQLITIIGGLLMVLSVESTTPIYLLVIVAGILSSLLYSFSRDWKNIGFHFLYGGGWMFVSLLTLDMMSFIVAVLISYTMLRTLAAAGQVS